MRRRVSATVFAIISGLSVNAYAGICIPPSTCVGGIAFCTACWAVLHPAQPLKEQQEPIGFSDKLSVLINGNWVRASGVYLAEVENGAGLVTLEHGKKTVFHGRVTLTDVSVYDETNGQQVSLAEIATPACPMEQRPAE